MPKISIAANINNAQESRPVPNGPYDLVIASAEEAKSKGGDPQLVVSIGIEGHINAPNVRHYISFPKAGEEQSKSDFKGLMLRRFLTAFGIPYTSEGNETVFDTDDFPGAKARMELTLTSPEESESGDQYNRLRLPKIKDESAQGGTQRGRVVAPPKRAGR